MKNIKKVFTGVGGEAPRDDCCTEERNSVVVAIKHWDKNEYLCINTKNRDCKSFVMGGIEDSETPEAAALREVTEETGYWDAVIDNISEFQIVNHFFAEYKGINRYAYITFVFGHLKSNKRHPLSEEEKKKHLVEWVKIDELSNFINVPMNKIAIESILSNKRA